MRTLATSQAALPPKRPPRDTRLDLLRGWMQLSIFISHATGTALAWGIHAAWGASDSSEQFLFLSGFSLGSVFALKAARDGKGAALRDLLGRTRRLWLAHMTVFLGFAVLVLGLDSALLPGEAERLGWRWFASAPWFALPAAGLGLYQPAFMGILPSFLWSMALLPAFLWATERVGAWALLPPALLYGLAQVRSWMPPGLGGTEVAFDPLAWQVLFLLGAFLGRRALLAGAAVQRHPAAVALALALVGIGLWARLIERGWSGGPGLDLSPLIAKEQLAPLRLLHALSLAYLVAVLVPHNASWMRGRAAGALAAIGRNSLQVFCVGLFLSYGVALALRLAPAVWWPDPALVVAGIVILGALALVLERRRMSGRSGAGVAGGAFPPIAAAPAAAL
jgi:hypothetical protein